MNVFVIPSWYPTTDYPVNGIFIKEQTYALCQGNKGINVGISLWGQKNKKLLLWSKAPIQTIHKLATADRTSTKNQVLPNLVEYTNPTFTWTRKIASGNFDHVVKANLRNLQSFEAAFGPVDIIHAHVGYPAGRIALEINTKLGIPFVLTEHMIPFPSLYDSDRNGLLTPFYRASYLGASANIAVSDSLAKTMRGIGLPHVRVLPNFVDEDLFHPAITHRLPVDSFTFFTLAEMIPRKGIDLLLNAIKELIDSVKGIKFRIGGEGSYLEAYKKLAIELGVDSHVDWLGHLTRKEAAAEHRNADAFVLPSRNESMGVVYIEALASGKPVIATKCGGPETIVTTFNGLLVDKDSVKQLVKALQQMAETAHTYNPYQIREDFLIRFSKRAVIPQITDLYEEILTSKSFTPCK